MGLYLGGLFLFNLILTYPMSHHIPCINPKAVIFDLDGTLLDTAPDIIAACNATLEHFGYQPIDNELAHSKMTAGMRELLKLGIPQCEHDSADIAGAMRSYFAQYYLDHINVHTKAFEGIEALLDDLKAANIKVAVVTNKYYDMAQKLLSQYPFYKDLALILGCDSIANSKPHPEPILKTLSHLNIGPYDAVYVGDHLNDIMAANRAKTHSAVALWGYGARECGDPNTWYAHFLLNSVADLRALCLK